MSVPLRLLILMFKLLPPAVLAGTIVATVYDRIGPAEYVAQTLLENEGQVRVCVGAASSTHYRGNELLASSYSQRVYIFIPSVLWRPRLTVVTYYPVSDRIVVEQSALYLFVFVVFISGAVWGTWRWWIRPTIFSSRKLPGPDSPA